MCGGVNAAKLDLTPKQAEGEEHVPDDHVVDRSGARHIGAAEVRGAVGDYRLAKYSNIKLNQKVPENVFKLKTTGKTKIVTPNG